MSTFILSIIIAAIISFILFGAYFFTGMGILIFIIIAILVGLLLFLFHLVKNLIKISIFVAIVVFFIFLFSNLSSDFRASCQKDEDCIESCQGVVNNFYYSLFVNKKEFCVGHPLGEVIPVCKEKKCSRIAKKVCQKDEDCICGGTDVKTDECFVGTKDYYEKFVDKEKDCPDFCTGIGNTFETRCVNYFCVVVNKNTVK